MLILKLHETRGKLIGAVCDSELLGKKFEDKGVCLDLSSDFYSGQEVTEDDFEDVIMMFNILNLVGSRAVGIAIKKGLVDKSRVLRVSGVLHAQVVNLNPVD